MTLHIPRPFLILATLCTIVLVGLMLTPHIIQYESIPLSSLRWERPPTIVAIKDEIYKNNPAILAIRLKDEERRYFVGKLDVSFSDRANAMVFGDIAAPVSKEKKQKLYYVEDGRKIHDINIDKIDGTVTSVQENPKATYLFIETTNNKSTNFCVIERVGDSQMPPCKNLSVGKISRGLWNPAKDHELVVLTDQGNIFTYDPWEKKPNQVYRDKKDDYQKLRSLFSKQPSTQVIESLHGKKQLFQFLTLALVIDTKQNIALYPVPLNSKVAWYNDGDHILVKERNRLGIIELSSRKKGIFKDLNNLKNKTVVYRLNGFDVHL